MEKPNKFLAIIELTEEAVSGIAPDGLDMVYHDGQTPPTEEAIQAKLVELLAEYDAQEYARNRASAFPSWQEQMDMQYHDQLDSTTTWKDAIAKVKSDNPKE